MTRLGSASEETCPVSWIQPRPLPSQSNPSTNAVEETYSCFTFTFLLLRDGTLLFFFQRKKKEEVEETKSLQITYVPMVFGLENEFLLHYRETNGVFRCPQTHYALLTHMYTYVYARIQFLARLKYSIRLPQ